MFITCAANPCTIASTDTSATLYQSISGTSENGEPTDGIHCCRCLDFRRCLDCRRSRALLMLPPFALIGSHSTYDDRTFTKKSNGQNKTSSDKTKTTKTNQSVPRQR